MDGIDRVGKGGKHYAHFTPGPAADLVAAQVNEEDLRRPDFRVADPCCGSGSLLVAVVKRRLTLGVPATVIADHLWACDIDPEYVEQCRAHVLSVLHPACKSPKQKAVCTASIERNVVLGDALQLLRG
jgi:predicted RNA methylase